MRPATTPGDGTEDFERFFDLMGKLEGHSNMIDAHTKALTSFKILSPVAEADLINRIVETVAKTERNDPGAAMSLALSFLAGAVLGALALLLVMRAVAYFA
jgi:hypothetical protein